MIDNIITPIHMEISPLGSDSISPNNTHSRIPNRIISEPEPIIM